MSHVGGSGQRPVRPGTWDRLELSVRRLMDDYQVLKARAASAEARSQELEATLASISGDGPDPIELNRRIVELEAENRHLLERLQSARAEIERIMARLQFLEG